MTETVRVKEVERVVMAGARIQRLCFQGQYPGY